MNEQGKEVDEPTLYLMSIVCGMCMVLPILAAVIFGMSDAEMLYYTLPGVASPYVVECLSKYSFRKISFILVAMLLVIESASLIGFIFIPWLVLRQLLLPLTIHYWSTHFLSLFVAFIVITCLVKYLQKK